MSKAMLILLLALLSCTPGCSEKAQTSTSILSVIPEENYFHLSVCTTEGGYNLERTYRWQCNGRGVEVVFDSAAETSGTIHFVFRDGLGRTVLERTYTNPDAFFARENTCESCPGTWSVSIHLIDFKGFFSISSISD